MTTSSRDLTASETYSQLEAVIEQLCFLQSIEPTLWMQCYTWVYYYSHSVLSRRIHSITERDRTDSPINLFQHLESTLRKNLSTIGESANNMTNKDLMELYIGHWTSYRKSCRALKGMYYQWIKYQFGSPSDGNDHISLMACSVWENVLFKPLLQRMIEACVTLSINERANPTNDLQLSNAIQIFENQEFNQKMNSEENLIDVFEKRLVGRFKDFYLNIPQPTNNRPLIGFLIKVKDQLASDEMIFRSFMSVVNVKRLKKVLDKTFVGNHLDQVDAQIKLFLRENDQQNLTLWSSVINHLPDTKTHVVKIVEEHLYQMGMKAIELVQNQAMEDPNIYIENIYAVYEACLTFVKETFNNDPDYLLAVNEVCQRFINENSVTAETSTTDRLLVRFCDKYLRKRNNNSKNDEFDQFINRLMMVFNYMNDKDVFEKLYRKALTKRLISGSSHAEDEEETIVSKFKKTCGSLYTSKMEQILNDVQLSKDLTNRFSSAHSSPFSFSAIVFISNSWPFSEVLPSILPEELRMLSASFADFYSSLHQGRRLRWLNEYSTGELAMYSNTQRYILQVSTYQMMVLLLFNRSLHWIVEQIQEATQIDLKILIKILYSLFQKKLCTFSQLDGQIDLEEKDIDVSTWVHLADKYQSDRIRVNLNVPFKITNEKKVTERVDDTIDQDRKMFIQSTIVRIMKANQTMQYTSLVQTVIEEVKFRFHPKIPMIKHCIDTLIDKEYLERPGNDKDCLRYLA